MLNVISFPYFLIFIIIAWLVLFFVSESNIGELATARIKRLLFQYSLIYSLIFVIVLALKISNSEYLNIINPVIDSDLSIFPILLATTISIASFVYLLVNDNYPSKMYIYELKRENGSLKEPKEKKVKEPKVKKEKKQKQLKEKSPEEEQYEAVARANEFMKFARSGGVNNVTIDEVEEVKPKKQKKIKEPKPKKEKPIKIKKEKPAKVKKQDNEDEYDAVSRANDFMRLARNGGVASQAVQIEPDKPSKEELKEMKRQKKIEAKRKREEAARQQKELFNRKKQKEQEEVPEQPKKKSPYEQEVDVISQVNAFRREKNIHPTIREFKVDPNAMEKRSKEEQAKALFEREMKRRKKEQVKRGK